ncbi:MAG: hypothetical protein RMM06_10365 [Armatimonadota bacterium]|nr:hypothetical protein [bacterium]MDW8291118.1 hypothetical protein [Armatimonadota bacterium]
MTTRCKYLRSKMDYVAHASVTLDTADMVTSPPQRHFWCLRTMKPLGPDGAPAEDTACVSGRECFVAEGEA